MKKTKLFARLTAGLLALVMAVPAVAYAAEGKTASAIQSETLYHWKASSNAGENLEHFKDNLLQTTNLSTTHWAGDLTVNTADGPKEYTEYRMINTPNKTYGLPYEGYGSAVSNTKSTESLKLEIRDLPVVRTQDYGAVNLSFVYSYTPGRTDIPVFMLDKLKVEVSIDGKTWVEGSVGMRSWTLIGNTKDPQGRDLYLIRIETNDLLDIEGLLPGDRIRGVRMKPFGDYYYTFGSFGMCELTVTGWPTEAAFETAVPDERNDLLDIGEEKMRQIVAEHAKMFASVPWVSDGTIYTDYQSVASDKRKFLIYGKGVLHHGLVYDRALKIGYEMFTDQIKDGKYIGGTISGDAWGADCYSYVYDCISRISREYSFVIWQTQSANSLKLMDSIKHDESPTFTNIDILPYNTEQEMYEGYAQLDQGDVITHFTTAGAVHIRITGHPATVVRNPDGTIDPDKSYVQCYEQTGGMRYYFRLPDGSVMFEYYLDEGRMPEALQEYQAAHPEQEFMYCTSTYIDEKYTFKELLGTNYVPLTLREYETGKVEDIDVQMLLQPKDFKDITNGFRAVVMTDHHVIKLNVKLVDKNTGRVLYEGQMDSNNAYAGNPPHIRNYAWNYTDNGQLDAKLASLPNGDYTIEVAVQAGPVTEVRGLKPWHSQNYDFTVTGSQQPAAPSAALTLSAQSVAAGQTLEVQVSADTAFKAADVEVAYDADKLTFVGGSVTASCLLNSVDAKNGVVRIMAVDAGANKGELAKLTFTAKSAAGADAVSVKSAVIEPGEGGGSQSTHTCPAAAMTDVLDNAWYHTAVDYALTNGLMSGYNATTFGPNDTLSRAMVVQVLYNKEGKPALTAGHSFPDVKAGDWFNNAVAWGSEKGVVSGFGDGKFRPTDAVTLEQVAVILHNYSGKPAAPGEPTGVGNYDDWAKQALSWAVEQGILKDVPFTNATENATRAQTAQMLMNYLSK